MCTVTYIPMDNDGYTLTSNRDETIDRSPAVLPRRYLSNGITLVYPQDPVAKGSWIVTSSKKTTLCLLNGAFRPHERQTFYRKSRGLVLIDFFDYEDGAAFASKYDFGGIEPFTMIVVEEEKKNDLFEIRWDGKQLHYCKKDPLLPQIWSSSTLYVPAVIDQRETWYKNWLSAHPNPVHDEILQFHQFGGIGDEENDLIMHRSDRKQTVSISSIRKEAGSLTFYYKDLLSRQTNTISIL